MMPPLAPNTITLERPPAQTGDADDNLLLDDETGEPLLDDDDGSLLLADGIETIATGLRVAITSPSGSDLVVDGHKEIVDAVMIAPTAPVIEHTDLVTDDDTAESWRVVWVRRRLGLGLDHQVAGLRAVTGGANG